jgi:hypothetical protein
MFERKKIGVWGQRRRGREEESGEEEEYIKRRGWCRRAGSGLVLWAGAGCHGVSKVRREGRRGANDRQKMDRVAQCMDARKLQLVFTTELHRGGSSASTYPVPPVTPITPRYSKSKPLMYCI